MSSQGEQIANTIISTMKNVNDAVGPFLPFVTLITVLTKEIAETYENIQYNKRTCGTLLSRIEAAEAAVKRLMREKEKNLDKFCSQSYYDSFQKFVNCLEKIKEFFHDISQLSKFKKFYTSGNIKETFERLIKEFDGCSNDLNLAISIATNEQLNEDLEILHADMIEMMKFLDNVEGGITNNTKEIITKTNEVKIQNQEIIIKIENIEEQNKKILEQNNRILEYNNKHISLDFTPLNTEIETIYILNKEVNSQKSKVEVKAKRIDSSEINEASKFVTRKGSRVIIQKKVYKTLEVACKPISMDNIHKIQKHLAILKKLEACPYIIKFHGLSQIVSDNVMVFEWAEYGTLRELYLKYNNIEWEAKISIARDICRGLIFLHTVEILHHDIRCENVLITENMQPKIYNFKFSREFKAATIPIDDINAIIHWLAPEKLNHISTEKDPKKSNKKQEEASYTIQCDIFSFAMLLWELGFQKKPYENMSISQIQKHVLGGSREKLDLGLGCNSIQKEYCAIIDLAWEQEPSLRPGIQHVFNMLQRLYENYVLQRASPLLHPRTSEFDDSLQNLTISDLDIGSIAKVTPLTPFKEGLMAHKAGDYEKAWKCFEEHAKIGDILAKYWQGYYYLEGKYQKQDKKRAKELFKEAADGGNADAQLRYAFCLIIDKENEKTDYEDFLKYLKMSADKNNATALYNLGEIYLHGKMNTKMDKNRGIQYLKLAALHNQPKAKEILKEYNVDLYN